MFERTAAAIVRANGGQAFAAPEFPEIDSVWRPEWQPALHRTVIATCGEFVCYRNANNRVRSIKLASWHRWRRLVRAYPEQP